MKIPFLHFGLTLAAILVGFCLVFKLGFRFFILRFIRRSGARPILRGSESGLLYSSLDRLSRRAHLRQSPTIYLLEDYSPNAFALQHGKGGLIVLTQGLLQILSHKELEAVLSLCLAQLKLKDFRSSPLATVLAWPFTALSNRLPLGLGLLLQTCASFLVRLFVRPERMFRADAYAAQILQNPDALAMALRKMTSLSRRVPLSQPNIALDHLLLISSIRDEFFASACATHPQPEDRIRRLLVIGTA